MQWHIRRNTTQTQLTDYVENDAFPAETHENALDRLTMLAQDQQRELGIRFKYPDTYTGGASNLMPEPSASKIFAWNSDADALENTDGRVVSTSATASGLSTGASPTVSVTFTASTGALAFAFGIPAGATGATGAAGETSLAEATALAIALG